MSNRERKISYSVRTALSNKTSEWLSLNLFHFSSGIGRTGIFIALSNSIEQINIEKAVNVFQMVKKMREQRSTDILTMVRKISWIFGYYLNENGTSEFSRSGVFSQIHVERFDEYHKENVSNRKQLM